MSPQKQRSQMLRHQIITVVRNIGKAQTVFVGVGLPGEVAYTAKRLYGRDISILFESGCIDADPSVPPKSVADPEITESSLALVSVLEMFNYWVAPGWVDVAVLGAAQVDKYGNINSTVIGGYDRPQVRLPGAGGAPTIANSAKHTIIVADHNNRALVPEVDFVTTPGALLGEESQQRTPQGPPEIVTDCGVLRLNAAIGEYELTHLHPGVTLEEVKDRTGWPLSVSAALETTAHLRGNELAAIGDLEAALATRDGNILI